LRRLRARALSKKFAAIEGFEEDLTEDGEVEVIDEDKALEEGTEES